MQRDRSTAGPSGRNRGRPSPPLRRRQRKSGGLGAGRLIGAAIVVAIISWNLGPQLRNLWTIHSVTPDEVADIERSVYFGRCAEARAAGVAPIDRGSPGYREGLDGDGDGVACEPYRR